MTSYITFLLNLNSEPKNTPPPPPPLTITTTKFERDQAILLKLLKLLHFSIPKNDLTHWKQRLPWHLRTISIVNLCTVYLKGVKLKWHNVISLSCGVFELLRKNLGGGEGEGGSVFLIAHYSVQMSSFYLKRTCEINNRKGENSSFIFTLCQNCSRLRFSTLSG